MPAPRYRSRTKRRVFIRTPGGVTKISYRQRKAKAPHCSTCDKQLPGIVTGTVRQLKNLPKSYKRPERPFAGVLCGNCMKRLAIQEARDSMAQM